MSDGTTYGRYMTYWYSGRIIFSHALYYIIIHVADTRLYSNLRYLYRRYTCVCA